MVMESTADSAGEQLVGLTSRDGAWFLEELCSMFGNISGLTKLLQSCQLVHHDMEIPATSTTSQAVYLVNAVYTCLQVGSHNYNCKYSILWMEISCQLSYFSLHGS